MPGNLVAIACVVDSSFAILAEWQRIFSDYVSPLLTRLYEIHTGSQFRIAFVCYAPACTRPNPLLSRTYFAPPPMLLKEISQTSTEYGIGQTGNGGGKGMAVLEGLVAAIEIFDILQDSGPVKELTEQGQELICHMIHIASCQPDSAERPLWNTLPTLDNVAWADLPGELRKRNISYSLIQIRPIQQLSAFHTTVSAGSGQEPWFNVRPHHIVQLMGYPSPQKGMKRGAEPGQSPEIKRPKLQSQPSPRLLQNSTVVATPKLAAIQAKPAPSATSVPATKQSAPTQLPDASVKIEPTEQRHSSPFSETPQSTRLPLDSSPGTRLQIMIDRLKRAQQDMVVQSQQANIAEAEGRLEEAQTLRRMVERTKLQTNRLNQIFSIHSQRQHSSNNHAPTPQTNLQSNEPVMTHMSVTATSSSIPDQMTTLQSPQGVASASVSQPAPHLGAQSHKPSEQVHNQPAQLVSAPSAPVTSGSAAPHAAEQIHQRWTGRLTWSGSDAATHTRRDMVAQVTMVAMSNSESIDLSIWPSVMTVSPSKDRAITPNALRDWFKRHKVYFLHVNPVSSGNEESYRALVRLLIDQQRYALAAWGNHNGPPQNRIVMFPAKNTLVAAYFLEETVPEFSKVSTTAKPAIDMTQIAGLRDVYQKLTPDQQAQFAQLPADKKYPYLILQQQQQLQQHKPPFHPQSALQLPQDQTLGSRQAMSGGMAPFMVGQGAGMSAGAATSNNMHGSGNMPTQIQTAGGTMMMNYLGPSRSSNNSNGMPQVMHQRTPSGGGGTNTTTAAAAAAALANGNVSLEMMQSFMQRNIGQDG